MRFEARGKGERAGTWTENADDYLLAEDMYKPWGVVKLVVGPTTSTTPWVQLESN